ncbi:phosphotransferase family protein [Psychrobacter sp. HD31]|uniref:phosphotransferase family protein n=1 Tax=Psychrobacter sp. HD31 TaxID=3112003 RepID=UPI003DA2E162
MSHQNKPNILDTASQVRKGEELDIQAVTTWLKSQGLKLADNANETAKVTQYSGGASNWTYRLEYSSDHADQCHDLILRRPPKGTKAKSAHDMVREYQVQNALQSDYPYVPKMVALCTDESVLGCDFYVMERLEGIIPRANFPKSLALSAEQAETLCKNVLDAWIALHQIDTTDNAELSKLGKGEGYCERQIIGWDKRYAKAHTSNVPTFALVRDWLKDNIPADSKTCLIHNDWRLDNVVLDPSEPTKVIGVLDWEMATLGDPLMDLGSALAYWVQADDDPVTQQFRRQPTNVDGMMTRQQVVDYYLEKTGLQIDNWTFYEVYGLFRLAGIAQQIYYRYYHKQTDNPMFKDFWVVIHVLNAKCLALISQHEGAEFTATIKADLEHAGLNDELLSQLPAPVQGLVKMMVYS